jgi:electron transport complex protein RnfG
MHDNDLDTDTIIVSDPLLSRDTEMTVYRARKEHKPVAAIIECIAPDGYSGRIRLLVAVNFNGTLAGVRVTEHLETPGLGDAIEANKSDWIHFFKDKSLNEPKPENWRVRRDGGEFDQITSATITSRAVVKATHNVLKYFKTNQKLLFN